MIPNASILSLLFGSTLFIGLLALGAYLVYYVLFIVIPRSRINTHKKEGVSTYFFPIGGFLHCLLQNFKQKNDFIYDLKHVSKTMPNPKYVATHIGKTFYIVLQDTKYIKEFLRKHASYKKTHFIYTMMPLMGNSLIIAEGETWKHHRRIISSAFTFDFLRENTPRIQEITKEILDKLTPEDYKNYSTLYNIQDITGEVIGRIIFGENLCNHKFDGKTLPRALNGIMEDISHIGLNHWFIIFGPRSMGLLSMTKYRNVMQRVKRFRKAVLDIVQARKKQANSGSGNDLLSILLATQKSKDPKDRFSDSDIVDEFITFLTVGMDNPGHLITMTLYNLTQHPEYLAKLQEERDNTYNQEKVITPDTLSKMDLLHAVFKETLRVYTPAPALFIREAIEDHEILDLKVKKGDMMNYAFSTPAMDNKYFEDADRFNPERWANQDPNLDPYAFTPFSAGQRNCIGQNLAILESKIIVSEFLERFNFNLQDGYKLRMSFRFLYEPREEMIMNLQPK